MPLPAVFLDFFGTPLDDSLGRLIPLSSANARSLARDEIEPSTRLVDALLTSLLDRR